MPVIVNAILNEHQIVVDIVAFVNKGDFPRSRLGEKQRGKILASWVTRKMRTMAQFGIRDADAALSDVNEGVEPRTGVSSVRNGSVMASSLRHVESAPHLLEQNEADARYESYARYSPPPGVVEMPGDEYNDVRVTPTSERNDGTIGSDDTPTEGRSEHAMYGYAQSDTPIFDDRPDRQPLPMPPVPGQKSSAYPLPLPVAGEREDIWSLPSQRPASNSGGGNGMLKVANPTEDEDDWGHEAIMHMNLAGHRNFNGSHIP